jgi:hypothetical protein
MSGWMDGWMGGFKNGAIIAYSYQQGEFQRLQ